MSHLRTIAVAVLLAAGPAVSGYGQTCSRPWEVQGFLLQGISRDFLLNGQGIDNSILEAAIGNWTGTCGPEDLPGMGVGDQGDIVINLIYIAGNHPQACGLTDLPAEDVSDLPPADAPGFDRRIPGATVTLWQYGGGVECDLEESLTHELGHVLGLGHADIQCAQGGGNFIMLFNLPGVDREVNQSDCEQAEESNPDSSEPPGGEPIPNPGPCGGGGGGGNPDMPCGPGGGSGGPGRIPRPNTPIVIDLGAKGLRFTGATEGVLFDMDADWLLELTAWTRAESGDGFLVRLAHGESSVTSAAQLFGDHSHDLGRVSHGFEALAKLDLSSNGGNRDGRISATDSSFGELYVWLDSDHDGRSSERELRKLSDVGIESISLGYWATPAVDRHGNRMLYTSTVILVGGRKTVATDVLLDGIDLNVVID